MEKKLGASKETQELEQKAQELTRPIEQKMLQANLDAAKFLQRQ